MKTKSQREAGGWDWPTEGSLKNVLSGVKGYMSMQVHVFACGSQIPSLIVIPWKPTILCYYFNNLIEI